MKRINVTKTFLPPIEEYEQYLKEIWQRVHLTNQGPLLLEFEEKAKQYLGVDDFHFVTNGTLALQVAMSALDITGGEVITTPFSYVATVSSILWEKATPVFVDIEPDTFCLDPSKIEAAITAETKAIMPVHVFGNPCDVEKIGAIAKRYKLKVIYDAAHAFGVQYKGKSLFSYGDISICSFHCTKLFHTIEGGAVIAQDKAVSQKVELIKRFGHNADDHYMLGINAKASEFQAAMGLCNLKHVDDIIAARKVRLELYNQLLGSKFQKLHIRENTKYNYGYYPVVLKDEAHLLKTIEALNAEDIFPRRYFYPSLNTLPYLNNSQSCPVSEKVASSIICLPLHSELEEEDIKRICEIVKSRNAT
ncbi:MAG TPA: DegT/DnrJ/EryC1/StrS family aminotransferase [Candidatus Saccharimonadales bacterium]|nr:DegT/DnrJ/EryC1/StrS family aminotransferase [Candidatus Saccharimonadales bacterium]